MFSIETRNVDIPTGDGCLRGTLTVPAGDGPFPAALLIVGSGPVNRDSDHPKLPLGVTKRLAGQLARVGIASLRYDKRGVGDSDGDFWSAGLHDNISDAHAALEVLRRIEVIDDRRLLVMGHSEGAFIATAVAAQEDIAGLALLAGGARNGEEILRWQAHTLVPTLPRLVRGLLTLFRVDVFAKQAKTFKRLRASDAHVMRLGGRRHNARWFREFLDFDPRPLLANIEVPVLAVTGSKDLQAAPEDVAAVGDLVRGPFEGHVIQDVNHILRHEPDRPKLRAYKRQAGEPLDTQVVERVTNWSREVTIASWPVPGSGRAHLS